jgi:broad specificity phosphatase PhoE
MTAALAATWHPRGEIGRLLRLYPQLQAAYSQIIISLPPTASAEDVSTLRSLQGTQIHLNADWSHGRYMALKLATETGADHIHYADMDRLLRWIETRPDEWRGTLGRITQTDCLVIGRTSAAWATHPLALSRTEAISTGLMSRLLGQELDISAGSKGFSRRTAEFILANSLPGRAIGTDAEWVVLAQRAGFPVEQVLVDGLDWEIPDQHQAQAAGPERQRELAGIYDADATKWAHRVSIAREIVEAGMDAWSRRLVRPPTALRMIETRRHSMRLKPGQHLSRAGVELARRIGGSMGPFDRVITSTIPRAYETAVAMGFAVDEQLESLTQLGADFEAEVKWDAGFPAYALAYQRGGTAASVMGGHARLLTEVAAALPPGGAALIVSHGGIVEAGVVGCLPEWDYNGWGRPCSWCEGARLFFDGSRFVDAQVLRVNDVGAHSVRPP